MVTIKQKESDARGLPTVELEFSIATKADSALRAVFKVL